MYFLCLCLILLTFNFGKIESKDKCNDDCLTKTYCLSNDGSPGCSNDDLIKVSFKVIPNPLHTDFIQMTLTGYKIGSDDDKKIQVSLLENETPNEYVCHKTSTGLTSASYKHKLNVIRVGSSYYKDNVLSCVWTFDRFNDIWPSYYDYIKVDMILYDSLAIKLHYGSLNAIVASTSSQLPIYHAKYLECCYKVHGNEKFSFIFYQKQDQLNYQMYIFQNELDKGSIILKNKDGMELTFNCSFDNNDFTSSLVNAEGIKVMPAVFNFNLDNHEMCSWNTNLTLGDSNVHIDASKSKFDLTVLLNGDIVYTDKDVTPQNSSNLIKFNLSFIFVVFIQLIINYV